VVRFRGIVALGPQLNASIVGQTLAIWKRIVGLGCAATVTVVASFLFAPGESTVGIVIDPPLGATALGIALGPVTGWIETVREGSVLMALWTLVPSTAISFGSLFLWIRGRSWLWLAVATATWIASGYFYAVAVRI
jgi:hypothetical protein